MEKFTNEKRNNKSNIKEEKAQTRNEKHGWSSPKLKVFRTAKTEGKSMSLIVEGTDYTGPS